MEQTDRQRPQPHEWLIKDYDDTGIDKGSEHRKQILAELIQMGQNIMRPLELIYSIWTREEKPLE